MKPTWLASRLCTQLLGLGAHLVLLILPFTLARWAGLIVRTDGVWFGGLALWCLFGWLESGSIDESPTGPLRLWSGQGMPLLMGLTLLGICWISLVEHALRSQANGYLAGFGAALMLTGMYLRCRAIRVLGPHFLSPIALRRDHQLITADVFSRLRHPSELGLLMIAIGASSLMTSQWGLILSLGVLLPLSWRRTRLEDQMLLEVFGHRFSAYQARTGGLYPRRLCAALTINDR